MCWPNFLQNYSLPIALGILTIFVSIFIPRRIFKNQVFSELLNEYRSFSMGIAVKHIWDFFRDDCNKEIKKVVDEYYRIKEIDEELNKTEEDWKNSLHYHRRLVSQFYRHIAMFLFGRFPKIRERKIKSFFIKGDFDILKIIVPIEQSFVEKEGEVPESFIYLSKLRYKSQIWEDTGICKAQYNDQIKQWNKELKNCKGEPLEEFEKEDSDH